MKNDQILPLTRLTAILVVPFLWLAFIILFFYPDLTGERFAWAIKPHMTSMYIGAGYLGGSWLFLNAIFGKRWHRIHGGFLAITTFTWFMLLATFLHWDRFSHGRLGFTLWLILYLITPLLVPVLWLYNRRTDSGQPEESDLTISPVICWIPRLIGIVAVVFVLTGFIMPQFVINIWPWTLTPLTARIMTGWVALLGVGALTMSTDACWSAWRTPLESIVIWHIIVLIAMFFSAADFKTGLLNWYTFSIVVLVVGILVYYPLMENQRRKAHLNPVFLPNSI